MGTRVPILWRAPCSGAMYPGISRRDLKPGNVRLVSGVGSPFMANDPILSILLNSTTVNGATLRPGSTIREGTAEAAAVRAAGGVLWTPDDAFLAALQGRALSPELVHAQALRQLGVAAATPQGVLATYLAEQTAKNASEEVLTYWGDSHAAGGGSGNENETGMRGYIEAFLREAGAFDVQGSRGYGSAKFGTQVWGGFGLKLNKWEHDGHSGQPAGSEVPVFGWNTSTGVFTSATHYQGVDRFVQLVADKPSDIPAPFNADTLYFVQAVGSATSFTLKDTSTGSAILPTQEYAGRPIRARFGLRAAARMLWPAYAKRPTRALLLTAGTNDCTELIVTRSLSVTDALQVLLARIVAYIDDVLLVGGDALKTVFYFGMPEFKPGSTTGANVTALQSLRDRAVAALPNLLASRYKVVFRDIYSGFPQSVFQGDGVHLRRAGNRLAARLVAETVKAVVPSFPGKVWPRTPLRRRRAPKVLLGDDTSACRVTMTQVYTLGTQNQAWGWTYFPRTGDLVNDATVRFMFWYGASANFANGVGVAITRVAVGATSTRYGVHVYVLGGAPKQSGATAPYFNAEIIEEQKGYVFAVVLADGWLSLFINGRRINRTAIAANNFTDSTAYLGYISGSLPAAHGLYRDFWHAAGSSVTDDGAIAAAEANYVEGERWPGTVDFRPLDEGTGSTINSAAGLTAGTFTAATHGTGNDGVIDAIDDPV